MKTKNYIVTFALCLFGFICRAQLPWIISPTTPFPGVLQEINSNFAYVVANGGTGSATNAILKSFGTGNDLTITNSFTLIDQTTNQVPGTGFPIITITTGSLTNYGNSCINGGYNLDSNVTDYTWGTLTNQCGYVLIFFPFNTNGTIGGVPQSGVDTTSTNYTWTLTNQILGNLKIVVAGATGTEASDINGTYQGFGTPSVLQFTLGINSSSKSGGNPYWWSGTSGNSGYSCFGTHSTSYGTVSDQFFILTANGYTPCMIPYFLWPTYSQVPNFPWPMFLSFAGYSGCTISGLSGAPTATISYTVTNGWMTRFIATNINDVFGTNYSTTITTNSSTPSAAIDWVVLQPNSPTNYTVVTYNPAGSFRWLNTYFASNVCTVCPVAPFYPTGTPMDSAHLNYFCQEVGACWSTIENGATNQPCTTCIPTYDPIELVPPGTERIVPGSPVWTTNLNPPVYYSYRAVLTATTNSQLAVNGIPISGIRVQTTTPTIGDIGNVVGGIDWISNGFRYFTGSTNGTTVYTKKLAP